MLQHRVIGFEIRISGHFGKKEGILTHIRQGED